jgi:hypothetical protein
LAVTIILFIFAQLYAYEDAIADIDVCGFVPELRCWM